MSLLSDQLIRLSAQSYISPIPKGLGGPIPSLQSDIPGERKKNSNDPWTARFNSLTSIVGRNATKQIY